MRSIISIGSIQVYGSNGSMQSAGLIASTRSTWFIRLLDWHDPYNQYEYRDPLDPCNQQNQLDSLDRFNWFDWCVNTISMIRGCWYWGSQGIGPCRQCQYCPCRHSHDLWGGICALRWSLNPMLWMLPRSWPSPWSFGRRRRIQGPGRVRPWWYHQTKQQSKYQIVDHHGGQCCDILGYVT